MISKRSYKSANDVDTCSSLLSTIVAVVSVCMIAVDETTSIDALLSICNNKKKIQSMYIY